MANENVTYKGIIGILVTTAALMSTIIIFFVGSLLTNQIVEIGAIIEMHSAQPHINAVRADRYERESAVIAAGVKSNSYAIQQQADAYFELSRDVLSIKDTVNDIKNYMESIEGRK